MEIEAIPTLFQTEAGGSGMRLFYSKRRPASLLSKLWGSSVRYVRPLLIQTASFSQTWESKCPHCSYLFLKFDGTEFQQVDASEDYLVLHEDIDWYPKLGAHPWAQISSFCQCLCCKGFFLDFQLRTIFNPFKPAQKSLQDCRTLQENFKRRVYFQVTSPLSTSLGAGSPWLCIRLESGDGFVVEGEEDLKAEIHVFPLLPIKGDPRNPLNFSYLYFSWVRRWIQRFYRPFQPVAGLCL